MADDIRAFLIPDTLAALVLLASTTLVPLLIIARLGLAAAGRWALAWVIGSGLFPVSLNMGSSLIVEAVADQSALRQLSERSMRHLAGLLIPAVALIVVAAPYLLLTFGRESPQTDVTLLQLLLASLVTNTAVSVSRSQLRMRMSWAAR